MMLEATDEQQTLPEFAMALRGYDRAQVDSWARQMVEWAVGERTEADAARERCNLAQREAAALREKLIAAAAQAQRRAEPSYASLGEEAAELFRRAAQAAHEIESHAQSRAEAEVAHIRKEAEDKVAAAAREAEEKVVAAKQEADKLIAGAEATCRRLMADLEGERLRAEDEIARLAEKRAAFVLELERLYTAIGSLAGELRQPAEINLTAENEGDDAAASLPPARAPDTPDTGDLFDYDRAGGP